VSARSVVIAACAVGALVGPARGDVDHTHQRLDRVLAAHVSDGLVDYAALVDEAADPTSDFALYLDELASGGAADEATWSREQQLAYWINAYNAFTLELIVNDYPIDAAWYMWVFPFMRLFLPSNSILMIGGRWDDKTFESVRGPITLGAIEHEILRAEIDDPRIHFAIVCASIGCPDLRDRAYHPSAVHEELDAAARGFIGDRKHVRVEDDGELRVSKIFSWFREDFDVPPPVAGDRDLPDVEAYGEDAGVARWLAAYGSEALRARITAGPPSIEHLGYDWSLNEQPPADR
jgi:hypothetical protein